MSRRDQLIATTPRRGLCREEAAIYVGVSPTLFDEMVADSRMPQPKIINARKVWDLKRLDLAFDALPDRNGRAETGSRWDTVSV
jgi:hypothetical protein